MTAQNKDDLEAKIRSYLFPAIVSILGLILSWGVSQTLSEVREIKDQQAKQYPMIQDNSTNIRLIQRDIQYINLDSALIKREIEELKKSVELR